MTPQEYRSLPDSDIAAAVDQLNQMARQTLDYAITVGGMLSAKKASLAHGEFGPWIEENLVIGKRQVQKLITLHTDQALLPNAASKSLLSIEQALGEIRKEKGTTKPKPKPTYANDPECRGLLPTITKQMFSNIETNAASMWWEDVPLDGLEGVPSWEVGSAMYVLRDHADELDTVINVLRDRYDVLKLLEWRLENYDATRWSLRSSDRYGDMHESFIENWFSICIRTFEGVVTEIDLHDDTKPDTEDVTYSVPDEEDGLEEGDVELQAGMTLDEAKALAKEWAIGIAKEACPTTNRLETEMEI